MLACKNVRQTVQEFKRFRRYKNGPDHWSVVKKKIHPVDKALAHFDDFYKQVFDKGWNGIREGLLGKQKYVAIVNNFADSELTKANFEQNGAVNIRTLFMLEKDYIQDELSSIKRSKLLKKIKQDAYKDNSETPITNEDDAPKQEIPLASNCSMEKSLSSAEIDEVRTVDSKNILSTEILRQFIPATKIKGKEDFLPESSHYKLYDQSSEFSVTIERQYDLHFPEHLNIYYYPYDADFEPSNKGETGALNYYLLDGGSVLPVLALDIKPGHKILDMCAAPGGKSLLAIQTLYPDKVVSNDVSYSRVNRIKSVYNQFLYDFKEKWENTNKIKVTNYDARVIEDDDYDRILVDVPCTTDRHSLSENDNNIFKPSRIKERLKLPEMQCDLLVNALRIIKKGGIVVYSTCSLSPIQNDGVVHMALKRIWEETRIQIIIKDISPALKQTRSIYKLAHNNLLRYGHLVLPNLTNNFGPTYFCKLKRIK